MKTVRLNHSSINTNLLPNITQSHTSASPISKTGPAQAPNSFNHTQLSTVTNSSSITSVTPQPSPLLLASNEQKSQQMNGVTDQSLTQNANSVVVRRLSVTARPGDIFYKVKDVTESSSTTDSPALTNNEEPESNQPNVTCESHVEQEIIIQASNASGNNSNNARLASTGTASGRKTTTWNVKRTQTTSLGLNTSQLNGQSDGSTSKDDSSIDLLNNHSTNGYSDPSMPVFSKDLLSIR
jgi:hypothetical protein